MEEVRVLFDRYDFKKLVSGKIIEIESGDELTNKLIIKMALRDIGYEKMLNILLDQILGD